MRLVRDNARPLTIDQMDANLLELRNRVKLDGDQIVRGKKTFNEAYCDSVESPIGTEVVRSKDVHNFISTNTVGTYDITQSMTNLNMIFTTSPILNYTPTEPGHMISAEFMFNNLNKGTIISEVAPVSPDLDPYNDTWIQIGTSYPRNIIKIFRKTTDTWI